MRAKRTREEWAAFVAELETSGESVERFCTKHRLERASLKWWRWRLRSERPARAMARSDVRLVPVDVVEVVTRTPTRVAVAISDVEVRVEVGTDVAYVGALVGALRSRC
jgi:hypothetical protein